MTRFLYAVAIVLALFAGWQAYAIGGARAYLDKKAVSGVITTVPQGKKARVNLMVFMSYSSPHSRDVSDAMIQAIQDADDVRLVFIPVIEEGKASFETAKLVMAAGRLGKYIDMHHQLMSNRRPLTDEVIGEMAVRIGLDPGALQAEFKGPDVERDMKNTTERIRLIRLTRGPAIMVNRKSLVLLSGGSDAVAEIKTIIQQARSS